jgi:hypothetical protein
MALSYQTVSKNEEKTKDYENFEKGMIYMKILKKGSSREKGGGGNEIHARCACAINNHNALSCKINDPRVFFALFTLSTYGTVVSNCF